MDKIDRIYALHKIFANARCPVARTKLEQELECSKSTVERLIGDMRLYFEAPIEYDRARNGYCYNNQKSGNFELPGLWFNASELHALLAANQLLNNVQPGFLAEHIAPLQKRIDKILNKDTHSVKDITRRIRILQMGARRHNQHFFSNVATALLHRKQLHIHYHDRQKDRHTQRAVSPQRLIHYRDNWYLDAYCHMREDLRSFSLDRMEKVQTLETTAKELSDQELDEYYADAYGIFAGFAKHTARLKFTPKAARWVTYEQWHPRQHGQYEIDGSYLLEIPYSDPRELIMDIMKYGADVEVVAPEPLRKQIAAQLQRARKLYIDE
jgi:predicted DNA-binding transcriptional regulator YafY